MSTTTTEQPKRNLEDFKKLGAALHQRLLLARTAPLLLKLQTQPEPLPAKKKEKEKEKEEKEDPVLVAQKNIGKPKHSFPEVTPDDMSRLMRKLPVFQPMKKVKVVLATQEQKKQAEAK